MAAFTWGAGGAQMTPEAIAAQRKVAEAMMAQGADYSPVESWAQGAARVAQGAVGGLKEYRANEAEKANRVADQQMIASLLAGQGAAPAATPAVAPAPGSPTGNPADAIASIESGGKYDILGPVTKTGDRAFGKYQVMGANVPQWTKAHLGQEMTPEQFLASPEAQDAVFKGQFGQYQQKYGPEGAARAWFAGEGGMNDMGRKDQLGTSVADYGAKFTRGMGGAPAAAPGAVAQAGPPGVAPAAAPAGGLAGVNPALIQALTSPYSSPATKKIAEIMLAQQTKRDPLDIEAKRLDIETKKRGLEAPPTVQRVKQPDGSEVALQWDAKTKTWAPLEAPKGGNPVSAPKLTEQQSKDVGFYNRGEKLLPRLEIQDQALTEFGSATGSKVSNYFKSDAYRQAEQTGRELLAVILRKDTGAAVTPQEFEMYGSVYLPRPGDDKATIEQKRVARKTAIEGLRMGLGPAEIIFKSREAADAARPQTAAPAAPAASPTAPPQGIDPKLWGAMTPEERALWK